MLQNYVAYFRNLAIHHKDIQHNPDAEKGDAAKDQNRFSRTSASQFLQKLPNSCGFPHFMIELYDTNTSGSSPFDVKQEKRGAFSIVDNCNVNDFAQQLEAQAKCEAIAYELLQQIWDDHYGPNKNRCTTPFEEFDVNNIEIIFLNGVFSGAEYGVRCEFAFKFYTNQTIAKTPEPGTFV